ncbi:hypothetical protein P5V15_015836 [Pogonomyrmex californicus]
MACPEVVYEISCKDCDATYIGQTKRLLKTRINEHFRDINKSNKSLHEFNWDNIKILDKEPSWKRIVSEMIHIKKQSHGLNKRYYPFFIDVISINNILYWNIILLRWEIGLF